LVDSLVAWLSVDGSLGVGALTTSTTDTDTVNHVALLGFVSETTGLVRARRTGSSVDNVELTVFPAAQTEDETQHIRLLLLVQFFEILVGTHDDYGG
jgi:hypothetical protein